jgi:hypothetical protein
MNAAINTKKEDILYWMLDYIKDQESTPYSARDVDACGSLRFY